MSEHWGMTYGARRAVVFLFFLAGFTGAANLLWTSHLVNSQAAKTRALCAEQRDVGGAPLQPNASKLGVKLVVDFRTAYAGLGCPGRLPPPNQELLKLAAKYGVKVKH